MDGSDLNVVRIRPDVKSYTLGLYELRLALEQMAFEFACMKKEMAKHLLLIADPHLAEPAEER